MALNVEEVLRGTARAATYNVILQVSFRLLTFTVNALVLRFVSSELLGLVNVRLILLYSTILFLSREAFRKACLSRPNGLGNERNWRQLINLTWCCIPIGVFSGLILGFLWAYCFEEPSELLRDRYKQAVVIFSLSAVCELVVEPLWLIGQAFMFVRARVLIEGVSLAAKCASTISLIAIFPQHAFWAFCFAQIMHSTFYIGLYYAYFAIYARSTTNSQNTDKKTDEKEHFPVSSLTDIFPKLTEDETFIEPAYTKLVLSFLKQSLLKQFLTEGERYIMTIFNVINFGQQGVYDVINNLGSLVARFVFLPIEDSYYVLFCQLLDRGKGKQDAEKLQIAGRTLMGVLKFVSLVGYTILVFGYSYSYLLLDIYGGKLLSANEGPSLLRWYCVYVFIIAINGITECFMFALMSKEEVDRYNHKMIGFSIVFLVASLGFTRFFGSVGFILANCLNMILRILHSATFIKKFFHGSGVRPLKGIIPSTTVLLSFVLSFVCCAVSEISLCCESGWLNRFLHIGVGAIFLFSVLVSILLTEKEFVLFLKEQWTGKLNKSKSD